MSKDLKRVSLLSFWATWAEPCKEINKLVIELAGKYPDTLVLSVGCLSVDLGFRRI
jgi:thiol-disulfide isomerase/thioredoxin